MQESALERQGAAKDGNDKDSMVKPCDDNNLNEMGEKVQTPEDLNCIEEQMMDTSLRKSLKRSLLSIENKDKGDKVLIVQNAGTSSELGHPAQREQSSEELVEDVTPPMVHVKRFQDHTYTCEGEQLIQGDDDQNKTQNVKNDYPLPPNVIRVEHKEENNPQVDNSDGAGLPIQSLQRDSLDHGIMEVAVAESQPSYIEDVDVEACVSCDALCASQEEERESNVSKENIISFLNETFRQRNVQIKDHFPDIKAFITAAKQMVQRNSTEISEPQLQRLRKPLTKAKKRNAGRSRLSALES